MPSPHRFVFAITAHNVAPYVGTLVASLAAQTVSAWRAVLVDDASTDDTHQRLSHALAAHGVRERFLILRTAERRYKARNVLWALHEHADPEDVVVMLDGDDWLASERALAVLEREYGEGWDVVWSTWRGSDGMPGNSDYLSPLISPRLQPFVTSHLFSFRARLFDTLRPRDLQDDEGRWFRAACDLAIAWPVLEQTIRRKFVDQVLYVYNRANPLRVGTLGRRPGQNVSQEQSWTAAILRARPRRRPPADRAFVQRHWRYYLKSALRNARLVRRYARALRRTVAPGWQLAAPSGVAGDGPEARDAGT